LIDFPDLLGMMLEDAVKILQLKEIPYQVIETIPAKKDAVLGFQRVIKQKKNDGIYQIYVCKVPDLFQK